MDLTFKTGEGIFNYRVCAIIINDSKLLAMKNDNTAYYYLPGGRVELHESADDAILREMREELCVDAQVIRPLWLNQNFFIEDTIGEKFHELCIYYLVDVTNTELVNTAEIFTTRESRHNEIFYWLSIESLKDVYLYPLFIKDKINDLPESLELLTTWEY
ncbi:MAG: NUDIX domain-containing protein [Eubacterium sp.]|nr:NUDIX domain-containing protein [Eubacterium sp.]MDE6156123.1 NUDIX domain-containing protein [Eubacterium sp.]